MAMDLPGAAGSGLRLDPRPDSVAAGRRWTRGHAAAVGASADHLEVIELLTSELVANAVVHGPRDGRITVGAARRGDTVKVTVADRSDRAPMVRRPGPHDLGGRGLVLLASMSTAWGFDLHPGNGKDVWFELSLFDA